MTNPFDSFAFATSDAATIGHERTMRDRLVDIHNVKDYGAKGDGVTDDWGAIMAALQWTRYPRTSASSNLVASFTGVVAQATFNGTLSGNTLTITGSLIGTVSVGQTISGAGITSCQITSGSVTSWVFNGATQTVGTPTAISTNAILTASAVTSGTIAVNDYLINNGGTDASPSTLIAGTHITSQQSGSTGGAGVYILFWPFYVENGAIQTFTSQPMKTVGATVTLTSSAQGLPSQYGFDANNSTVAGNGVSSTAPLNYPPGITITFQTNVAGLVNVGDSIAIDSSSARGTIYFPPGNYVVSQPIDFSASAIHVTLQGQLGGSTITGNFNDYVIKQTQPATTPGNQIEKLNIVNLHATGGGVRFGATDPGAIRSCTITANRGISDYSADIKIGGAYFGSFEFAIEDCTLSPGANYTGSIGIMRQCDGPITNCRIIGYEIGISIGGGEGAQVFLGNYIEKCGTGFMIAYGPDGGGSTASGVVIAGCWFKNNSTGINIVGSSSLFTFIGIRIEGTNGQAPSGGNPQYGILSGVQTSGSLGQAMIAGVNIVGDYAHSGIYFNGRQYLENPIFMGVAENSTSPQPFFIDPTGAFYLPPQIACSARHIYTVAQLPTPGIDVGQQLNVSDGTNGLAWGAPVTNTGTHTTPYLVGWNGSNWTVMGK